MKLFGFFSIENIFTLFIAIIEIGRFIEKCKCHCGYRRRRVYYAKLQLLVSTMWIALWAIWTILHVYHFRNCCTRVYSFFSSLSIQLISFFFLHSIAKFFLLLLLISCNENWFFRKSVHAVCKSNTNKHTTPRKALFETEEKKKKI